MRSRRLFGAILLTGLVAYACQSPEHEASLRDVLPLQDYKGASPGMMALPMNPIPLEDLQAFRSPAANWQIAGNVLSDYQTENSMVVREGTGVLVNLPTEEVHSDLSSKLEHGDLELKLEVLVPKGSNSGLYFQGRYELQINDSWRVEEPEISFSGSGGMGGIYERWDDSRLEGQEGFERVVPRVNAALAPGLWQEFHVLFRAPRFDKEGNKVQNAKFEKVFLNGMLIHEDVELTGPTRGAVSEQETELAPLRIQATHGPVAFRNIGYKTFGRQDSLGLGPLEYTVYEYNRGQGRLLLPKPEILDTLPVLAEGVTDSLNVLELSPRDERFAIWFSGDLEVPVSGEYLFQTLMGTGGNLYIDGELVTTDIGRSYLTLVGNTIHLEEGTHQLEISYFKRRYVNPLTLIYEGPGMERRTLASKPFDSGGEPSGPSILQPQPGQPVLIGGFVEYGVPTNVHTLGRVGPVYRGQADPETSRKRTHALSVGLSEGVHYTYDLTLPSLLKFWRDPFADQQRIWYGRDRLLIPLNAAVENETGLPVALLQGDELRFFQNTPGRKGLQVPEGLGVREYQFDESGRPVFHFEINEVSIEDKITPSFNGEGLSRTLRYRSDTDRNDMVSIVAQGERIDRVSDSLYRVKNYYIELDETDGQQAIVHEKDGRQAIVVPLLRGSGRSEIRYQIIW